MQGVTSNFHLVLCGRPGPNTNFSMVSEYLNLVSVFASQSIRYVNSLNPVRVLVCLCVGWSDTILKYLQALLSETAVRHADGGPLGALEWVSPVFPRTSFLIASQRCCNAHGNLVFDLFPVAVTETP